jgi:hypothetical protein
MGRILGIELRRSPAAFIALLSTVVGAGLLMSAPPAFAGRWMQLAVATRLDLLILLPLALAGGAWLGRRDAVHRVGELFASTVRPRWQRVLPTAVAFAIAVVTAYLLVFLIGMAWVAPDARYFPVATIAVTAVGALGVLAAGWLGMAVGRAIPRLVTAPALAVIGAGVAGFLPMLVDDPARRGAGTRPAALLLTPIHDGNIDDFQTILSRVNVAQSLWLAALAVTSLLLLGAVRRRGFALALVPAVLGAAIALPLLPAGGYAAAAAVDPAAGELTCDDDGPQICVTRVHAHLLPDIAGPARQALFLLAAKVPGAPVRVAEGRQLSDWARTGTDPAPAPHDAGTLVFNLSRIGISDRADYATPFFLSFLIQSAWTQECATEARGDDVWVFEAVAAAWVKDRPDALEALTDPGERERADDVYRALTALPPAEQGQRMARARAAALDCRSDALLPSLTKGAA